MPDTYRITPEQEKFLDSFTCERLRDDDDSFLDVMTFRSKRGRNLVRNMQTNGWYANTKGSIAYYVVRNQENKVVLFFSLKCGVLFDPNPVIDFMHKFQDIQLYRIWLDSQYGDPSAIQTLSFFRSTVGEAQYQQRINQVKAFHQIKADKHDELNTNMVRVFEGLPAIELVEFCANDATKGCWDKQKMGQNTMGVTLFWKFIYPKMVEISSLIGCDYAFLFAADESPDGTLVQYYESLHFRKMPKMGTVKPYYDMTCYFMGKRLRTLEEEQLSPYDREADADLYGLDHYCAEFFRCFNQNQNAKDLF